MNDPTPSKVRRVSDLPREIPPPHDGWPALEARLRASGMQQFAQSSVIARYKLRAVAEPPNNHAAVSPILRRRSTLQRHDVQIKPRSPGKSYF